MLIQSITGATSLSEQQIQKPIGSLLVVINGDGTNQVLANETITLKLVTKSGQQRTLLNSIPLRDLLRVEAQRGEGYFERRYDAVNTTIVEYARGSFPLAADVGVGPHLENGDYLALTMSGMETTATYVIYGIECPATTNVATSYDQFNCPQNQKTVSYDLSNYEVIAIPAPAVWDRIDFDFDNGNTTSVLPEELYEIGRMNNDVTAGDSTLFEFNALAYEGYIAFNCESIRRVTFTNTGGTSFTVYCINTK